MGLLGHPQSKSDIILYDSRYRWDDPRLFCFLFPRRAGGYLVPGSRVGRVKHILASPAFSRIWVGFFSSALNTSLD